MAKIIDFKTRQVLADFPSKVTKRKTHIYQINEKKEKETYVIATNFCSAERIWKIAKIQSIIKKVG